jgi:hypothetical protein
MAVYNCECGLIVSTSSDRPQCLRCLRVLGSQNLTRRAQESEIETVSHRSVTSVVVLERPGQFRQVTMGYRLNERPVLSPIVPPK